jgi:hypothetical protein
MMKYDDRYTRYAEEPTGQIPTGKEPLQALFRHLEKTIYQVDSKGITRSFCDGTLMRTEAFLSALGLWSEDVRKWLERYGGYCDCEVVMNVGSCWKPLL